MTEKFNMNMYFIFAQCFKNITIFTWYDKKNWQYILIFDSVLRIAQFK